VTTEEVLLKSVYTYQISAIILQIEQFVNSW